MLKNRVYNKISVMYQSFVRRSTWNLKVPGFITVENALQCIGHNHIQELGTVVPD